MNGLEILLVFIDIDLTEYLAWNLQKDKIVSTDRVWFLRKHCHDNQIVIL